MKRIVLRAVLVGLLFSTVASNVRISAGAGQDISGAVTEVLKEHGFSAGAGEPVARTTSHPAIQFRTPGCDGLIEVVPIDINLQEAPLFDTVGGPAYVRRIAYLDRTWLAEDRLGIRIEWLKNKALSIFGRGRFVTVPTGLLIAEPPGCHIARTINWSLVWDRRTVATAQLAK